MRNYMYSLSPSLPSPLSLHTHMFTHSSDVDLFTCNVSSDSVIAVAVDTVSRVSGIEDFTFESLDTNHYDIIGGKGSGNF